MPQAIHPFLAAAREGDILRVRDYLRQNIDVNMTYHGANALHLATQFNHAELVKELLESGMDVDALDGFKQTALWKACQEGYAKLVDIFLKHGANPNLICRRMPPLAIATENNHIDCVNLLLNGGADINLANEKAGRTPVYIAIQCGYRQLTDRFLEDNRTDWSHTDMYGLTPLMTAASKGDEITVRQLLNKSIDFTSVDALGRNAAEHAERMDIEELFQKKGIVPVDKPGPLTLRRKLQHFLKYLEENHPNLYSTTQFDFFNKHSKQGFCFGYAALCAILIRHKKTYLLQKALHIIANTNHSDFVSCHPGSLLFETYRTCLDSIMSLHMHSPTNFLNPRKHLNAHAFLGKDCEDFEEKAVVGFVFKTTELPRLLELAFDIHSTFLLFNRTHVITLDKNEANAYQAYATDCDETAQFSSLEELSRFIAIIFSANKNQIMGLYLMIIESESCNKTFNFSPINEYILSLLEQRKNQHELYIRDAVGTASLATAIMTSNEKLTSEIFRLYIEETNLSVAEMFERSQTFPQALALLALKKRAYLMKILLALGANPNKTDTHEQPPLVIAADNGDQDSVSLLLSHGASPNQTDSNGSTPLYLAARGNHFEVVEELVRYGALIDTPIADGCTPLIVACAFGHTAIVEFLLKKNASPFPRGYSDNALDMAIIYGHLEVVKLLYKYGVSLKISKKFYDAETCAYVMEKTDIQNYIKRKLQKNQGVYPKAGLFHSAPAPTSVEELEMLDTHQAVI